ncbi:hypothetical protein ACFCW4_03315 [Streptomyces virginiae]|uniref:hypothetical protein n=1 Tax=Streptomyces virginiae TaxID=1961 RepID=UPI0035D60F83
MAVVQYRVLVPSNRPACSKYRFAAWAPPQKAKAGQVARHASTPAHGVSVIDLATNSVSATIDSPEGALIGIDLGSVPGTSKVSCPAGSVLTGGGFGSTGPAPDQLVSRPVPGTSDWEVNGQNRTRDDVTLTPYAVCATP